MTNEVCNKKKCGELNMLRCVRSKSHTEECAYVVEHEEVVHLPGIPRQCKHCNIWTRYDRPENKKQACYTVKCPFCHREFEVIVRMKGGRK